MANTKNETKIENKAVKAEVPTEAYTPEKTATLDGLHFQMDVPNPDATIEERLPADSGADTSGRAPALAEALSAGPPTFE